MKRDLNTRIADNSHTIKPCARNTLRCDYCYMAIENCWCIQNALIVVDADAAVAAWERRRQVVVFCVLQNFQEILHCHAHFAKPTVVWVHHTAHPPSATLKLFPYDDSICVRGLVNVCTLSVINWHQVRDTQFSFACLNLSSSSSPRRTHKKTEKNMLMTHVKSKRMVHKKCACVRAWTWSGFMRRWAKLITFVNLACGQPACARVCSKTREEEFFSGHKFALNLCEEERKLVSMSLEGGAADFVWHRHRHVVFKGRETKTNAPF